MQVKSNEYIKLEGVSFKLGKFTIRNIGSSNCFIKINGIEKELKKMSKGNNELLVSSFPSSVMVKSNGTTLQIIRG